MKKLYIISNVEKLKKKVLQFKISKKTVGYVPTLGGIHEGHLKLIRLAKKKSDIVVVSIFLNPLQFESKKDFQSYPTKIKDLRWHDLRRSAVGRMFDKGLSVPEVQLVGGWKNPMVLLNTYTKLNPTKIALKI